MSRNHMISGLAVGVLSLLAGLPALAQELEDAQLFAPADVSNYDGDQELKHGYFGSFDALYWNVGKPETASLGLAPPNFRTVFFNNDAAVNIETSSGDTSSLQSTRVEGNRIEFGYMGDYNGWFIGGYKLQDQFQQFELQNVSMVLNDPVVGANGERSLEYLVNKVYTGAYPYIDQPGGAAGVPYLSGTALRLVNMPLIFPTLDAQNTVQNYGAEANFVRRFKPFHNGGNFDLYLGIRYWQFNEEFDVETSAPSIYEQLNTTTPTNVNLPRALNDSYWNTEVTNSMIGPQVGGRYYKNWGRLQMSLEGKFAACFNEQTFRQDGEFFSMGFIQNILSTLTAQSPVANGTPFNSTGGGFSNSATAVEFSPLVELRAEARFQLFENVSLHAGWNGLWVDGIARASQSINYTYPTMGIDTSNNNTSVFIDGVTIGIDVNR